MWPYELLYKETPNIFLSVFNSRKMFFYRWTWMILFMLPWELKTQQPLTFPCLNFTVQKLRINLFSTAVTNSFHMRDISMFHLLKLVSIFFLFTLPALSGFYHCKLLLMFWKTRQGKSQVFQRIKQAKVSLEENVTQKITWIHGRIKILGQHQFFLFYNHNTILTNNSTTKTDH